MDVMYYACKLCQGLMESAADFKTHQIQCDSKLQDTNVKYYACPAETFLLLKNYTVKQLVHLLHANAQCVQEPDVLRVEEENIDNETNVQETERVCDQVTDQVVSDNVGGGGQATVKVVMDQSSTNGQEERKIEAYSYETCVLSVEKLHEQPEETDCPKDSVVRVVGWMPNADQEVDVPGSEPDPSDTLGIYQATRSSMRTAGNNHPVGKRRRKPKSGVKARKRRRDRDGTVADENEKSNQVPNGSADADDNEAPFSCSNGHSLPEECDDQCEEQVENMKNSNRAGSDKPSKETLSLQYKSYEIDDDRYKCPVCSNISTSVRYFHRHMITQHLTAHVCHHCGESFINKTKLRLHTNKHTRPFSCDKCPKRFASRIDLDRHLLIHNDAFPIQCTECDYKCRSSHSLKAHMREHSGNLLKCGVPGCQFVTKQPSSLTSHRRAKHEEKKRFMCHLCGYQTSNTTSFRTHQKIHAGVKDFLCLICNFRGVTKHDVIRHMRRHTQEKLYFCDRCQFSTGYGYALRRHMMVHLGVKPYQCSECGYNNTMRSKVVNHVGSKHPGAHVVNLGLRVEMDINQFRRDPQPTGLQQKSQDKTTSGSHETEVAVNECLVVARPDDYLTQHVVTMETNSHPDGDETCS